MTPVLQIANDFALPIDAVTTAQAILAKRGAGKSNAAVKMAEEMYKAGVPWVSIDPKGDWWGMRSSADGKKPGLPLIVFGGRHGDLPLEPTAGAMIADLVLEHRLTCILDVSEFTKADTRRFLVAFADRLYRQADREPLHLFLEEAHEYLPQQVRDGDAPLVGVWQKIVKQGRFKGIGCTLITQRSASLNKDVLTQVDTLIVMRTTSPQDRAAVKAWVDVHLDSATMMDTLPSLANGEAWIWSPEFLGKLERIQFRRRETFDSGATPKVGEVRRPPTKLADIDLGAIKTAMAATIERAQADDPKTLRARIAQLEKQLKAAPVAAPPVVQVPVEVQVPVIPIEIPHFVGELRKHLGSIDSVLAAIDVTLASTATSSCSPSVEAKKTLKPQVAAPTRTHEVQFGSTSRSTTVAENQLTGPQRKLLTVLAIYGPMSKLRLAAHAGYSGKGGAFNNTLSSLRTAGMVQGDPITSTAAGLEALGQYEPLPTGSDLVAHWLARLTGPQGKLLTALVNDGAFTKSALAEATGYSAEGGSFNNTISSLVTLGLVVRRDGEIALADEFAEAIAG